MTYNASIIFKAASVICWLLAAGTFATFLPSLRNDFIALDDPGFIYANRQVLRGLEWETVLWALRSTDIANWYPLTRITHLADVTMFGMWAGGPHLMSGLLHASAAGLLCAALCLMTGTLWRSLAVACLFAVHPLQVESVAWAVERSNVLAGFFFALTLLLWARYVRRPGAGRYAASVAGFSLGLMSKPVLVTLPLLLLLLDYWPLGRLGRRSPARPVASIGRLLFEKGPLLGLAALSSAVTLWTQSEAGAVHSDRVSIAVRIGNAALSYVAYLRKLFWPADLAVYYPHPTSSLSWAAAALAGTLLVVLTALAVWHVRRPWLIVGWLWYLGMLVPMIGLVQVGAQAMADRYAYLPMVGLALALVWTGAGVSRDHRCRGRVTLALPVAIIGLLMAMTVGQLRFWRDSETLFRHTLAVTSGNWLTHGAMAEVLRKRGALTEAVVHYREAIRFNPEGWEAHNNLALILDELGDREGAHRHLQEAFRLRLRDTTPGR